MASSIPGSRVVVLDNGGDTCKVGMACDAKPRLIANYALKPKKESRLFIATEIDEILEFASIYYKRPIEKGFVTNWELETQIWQRVFGKKGLDLKPKDNTLLITEPLFNPTSLRKSTAEVAFEKFDFGALYRCPAAPLAARGFHADAKKEGAAPFTAHCCLVVDSGYSFTHTVPIIDFSPVAAAVKRINVGGKLLTNALKEVVSFRAWNMMDETHTMTDVKHKLCYVALDFLSELEATKKANSAARREFVMPNWTTRMEGYVKPVAGSKDTTTSNGDDDKDKNGNGEDSKMVKEEDGSESKKDKEEGGEKKDDDEQCLVLNNERISIPEILFSPSDIGIPQAGIGETIMQSLKALPEAMRAPLLSNILVVGGNALFPNFAQRLELELRQLAEDDCPVRVHSPEDPLTCAWRGGAALGRQADFSRWTVTRAEWAEHGENICLRRFPFA